MVEPFQQIKKIGGDAILNASILHTPNGVGILILNAHVLTRNGDISK